MKRSNTTIEQAENKKQKTKIPTTTVRLDEQSHCLQLEHECTFLYEPHAIDASPEDLQQLKTITGSQERIQSKLYGKVTTRRRNESLHGIPVYRFSRHTMHELPGPMPTLVQKCINYMAARDGRTPDEYWAFVNYYKYADDYIPAHSDDEDVNGIAVMKNGPEIATFTFCDMPRVFRISRLNPLEKGYTHRWDLRLANGSCGIMQGHRFQSCFEHEVRPMSKKDQTIATNQNKSIDRLSVTVRAKANVSM